MSITIQPAGPEHLETVEAIVRRTIAQVYPRYYPTGAVAFFQNHHSRENIARDLADGRVWLAVADGRPVGTVTLTGSEIGRLFVTPEDQGMGAGRALMRFAEETLFAAHDAITLHASLPARRLYRKNGYTEVDYHIIETPGGDFLCFDEMQKRRPEGRPEGRG